jgi:hypothetical protein
MTTRDSDAREVRAAAGSRTFGDDAVPASVLAAATGSSDAADPFRFRSRLPMIDDDRSSIDSPEHLRRPTPAADRGPGSIHGSMPSMIDVIGISGRRPELPAPAREAALITI